jgi:hypothetical protein
MKLQELFAAGLLMGLAAHLGFRVAPSKRAVKKYELRQHALRRMAEVAERSGAQRLPAAEASSGGRAIDFSRYALPIGLHLDRARQVIEAARRSDGQKTAGAPR